LEEELLKKLFLEKIIFYRCRWWKWSDIKQATQLARAMVTEIWYE
jgi:ATP-dependent Zn protease